MSERWRRNDCVGEDLLAGFAEGRIHPEQRRGVLRHITSCERCRELVLATIPSSPETESHRSHNGRRSLLVARVTFAIALALLVAAILVVFFGPSIRRMWSRRMTGIAALVEASATTSSRVVEGRLTGGFAHKPLRRTTRGAAESHDHLLREAATRIATQGADRQAAGVARLLMGDDHDGVRTLEEAARERPDDPLLLSDLSAAYHMRATARGHAPDHAAALDLAQRSWRMRETPETAWNRAIAVSALHLTDAATRAWDDVLRLETDPGWRREAVERRAHAATRSEHAEWQRQQTRIDTGVLSADGAADVLRRHPARSLAYFEEEVLPKWAAACLGGDDATARRSRAIAATVAASLASQGEEFAAETLAAIDEVCSDESACRAVARAHARHDEGVTALRSMDIATAAEAFESSAATLGSHGSPYALLAHFHRIACLLHGNRFGTAATDADAVLSAIGDRRYRALRARLLGVIGLTKLHQARPEESIAIYEEARRLSIEGDDVVNLAAAEMRLADAYEYAGDPDAAMRHRLAGFAAMKRSGETKHLPLALLEAGTSASSRGWPDAAEFLFAECTREAETQRKFAIAALASMRRAMVAARRGDLAAADEHAARAAFHTGRTADAGQRALVEATTQPTGVGRRASPASITETIAFFERAGTRAWLPQLLGHRARLHVQLGRLREAEADLRAAIDVAEDVLTASTAPRIRDGFSSDVRGNYELLIDLLLRRGASSEALQVAEQVRLLGRQAKARDVATITRSIPPSTAAIVFELQADDVVAWILTRDGMSVIRTRASRAVLDELEDAMEEVPSAATRSALYDLLVRNWIGRLAPETHLVLLPSPALAGVPFGALLDGETGRALIEDHPVTIAASLDALSAERVTVTRSDPILIVGDPSYRKLARLPASRREALEIAQAYDDPILLLDERATGLEVLSHLQRASVVHFGVHAIANDLAPEMSSILLASDGADDSRLYVHELLQRRMPMKLVVLSACSTARSRSGDARGTLTITRAFIDGGARVVVGTRWPVSDTAAAAFSRFFHHALLAGDDVARAARAAQLRLRDLAPEDPTWAAFCVFQGNTITKEKEY